MFIVVNDFRAVLLLDEADAFLVERTSEAKAHDSTVTTFLHALDSLRGIFFLTTNREMVFDRASMSRIQMEISYPKLIPEFRRTIWKTQFCMAQKPVEITENELGKLAAMSLDGRQVILEPLIAILQRLTVKRLEILSTLLDYSRPWTPRAYVGNIRKMRQTRRGNMAEFGRCH